MKRRSRATQFGLKDSSLKPKGEGMVECIAQLNDEELVSYQNSLQRRMLENAEENSENVYRSAEYRNYRLRRHLQLTQDEQQKRKASD